MEDNGFPPFRPPPWLRGPHLQTLGSRFLARPPLPAEGSTERLEVEVEPGERLFLFRDRPAARPRGRLLLLHGLGGDADSRHLLHLVSEATSRGWETVRLNARGAGEGIRLSRRIPHAGRWEDVAAALAAEPWSAAAAGTPRVAVGVSLGGSILLNHLGRTGLESGLRGAVVLNPPTDLDWSLRELERPANAVYHLYYTSTLLRSMRRRARLYPGLYAMPRAGRHRSVRALDEAYVARDAGYDSAAAYYAGCSARSCVAGIRIPTWVLSARDDPFVPAAMLQRDLNGVPAVRLWLQPTGGHVGYVERRGGRLAFWASRVALAAAGRLGGLDPALEDDLVS